MFVDLIGYAAGLTLAVCYLPQVLQTWQSRRAEDLSLWMIMLTLLSAVLYEVYAGLLGLWPVVIMNGIFGILVAIQLALKLRYSRPGQVVTSQSADSQ